MRRAGTTAALILGILSFLMLAGCSGGAGASPLYAQVGTALRSATAAKKAAREPRAQVTRARLDTLTDPFLEVTVERRDVVAYLFSSSVRRDGSPGEIQQWRSDDAATITMRNGMLIATRGLGGDIMSSTVPVAEGVTGPASGGEKIHDIRTGDLAIVHLVLACDLTDLGPETIVIVERAHATRHLSERCIAEGGGTVENDYWVDSRAGIVWQSRQWAGPHIGYLRFRRLTE